MQDIGTFPIRLDDKPYYIEIGSWKARDVTDFSPKTTVPGTGAVFGSLQLYQPISQTNWQHGSGFIWHEDEAGYLSTEGNIDTRHKSVISLFTNTTSSDTNDNQKEGGLVFKSIFFAWGDAGVRYYQSASWSAANVQRPLFDAASEGSFTGVADTGTSTVSHTVTAEGSSRCLLVGVCVDDVGTDFSDADGLEGTSSPGIQVTFPKGGSATAMTVIPSSGGGTSVGIVAFYMVNPDTGAGDIIVTADTNGGTTELVVIGASFIYVDQTTPVISLVAGNEVVGTAATATLAVSAPDRELVVDFLALIGNESTLGPIPTLEGSISGNNQLTLAIDDQTTGTDITLASSYYFSESADTTPDIKWTWTGSVVYAYLGLALNPIAEVTITSLFENGEFLFAVPNEQRIMRSTTGTADFLPAGANNKSNDYSWLEIHGGYIFAGKEDEAEVYFDTNSDLSSLYGDPGDDADELVAGPGTTGTIDGISFLEKLAVSREDGLWTMDTDDATTTNWISKRTLNFKNLRSDVNFRSMATHGGSLYFSIQDKLLYQWNGAKLQDITPSPITDSWEYTTYYRFDNFTPFGPWLLFTARTSAALTGNSGYSEVLIAWDGVGIHKLADLITDGDGSISMLAIDPTNNYIWCHVNKPTAATNTTYYIPYQDDSDFPFAGFPTSGTHRLTTSRIHGGFRRVDKSMPSMWLETDNCNSTQTIKVEYNIDGDSTWHTWDTITSNGEHLLILPQNQLTEEFKFIQFRFTLVTASSAQTPIIEGYAFMVLMRPDFKMGYTFDVIGGTGVSSGMFEDDRTGHSIMHDLRDSRDMKSPISLVTPFGDEVYGYLTSLTENAVEWEPEDNEGGEVNILQIIRCNFVETLVIPGTEQDVEPSW